MDTLSGRDLEHVLSLLNVQETCTCMQVSKFLNAVLSSGMESERIWKMIYHFEFGGPYTGKSWRTACKVATKDLKLAASKGEQKQIRWAASGGHVALLRRFQREGTLNLHYLEKPRQLLQAALDKNNVPMIEWCANLGILDFLDMDWATLITKSNIFRLITDEEYFKLVKFLKLDVTDPKTISALLHGLIGSQRTELIRNHLATATQCVVKGVHLHRAVEQDNAEILGLLHENVMKYNPEEWQAKITRVEVKVPEPNLLLSSILHRKFNSFVWLTENGADLRCCTASHKEPIHCAATKMDGVTGSSIPFLDFLATTHGVNVNKLTSVGHIESDLKSPLHFAVQTNDMEAVEYLIQHGADMEIHTKHQNVIPLFLLVREPQFGLLLLDKKINPSVTYNHENIFMNMLKWVRFELPKTSPDPAIWIQFFERLKALGVSPNERGIYGQTIVHTNNHLPPPILQWLVEKGGIDVNAEDYSQNTPIVFAVSDRVNNISFIQYLIDKGAHLNTRNCSNRTVLKIAQDNFCKKEVIDLLVKHGARLH